MNILEIAYHYAVLVLHCTGLLTQMSSQKTGHPIFYYCNETCNFNKHIKGFCSYLIRLDNLHQSNSSMELPLDIFILNVPVYSLSAFLNILRCCCGGGCCSSSGGGCSSCCSGGSCSGCGGSSSSGGCCPIISLKDISFSSSVLPQLNEVNCLSVCA